MHGPDGRAAMLKAHENIACCTIDSVKMGAKCAASVSVSKTIYEFDDQTRPEAFAGEFLVLIGTLDKTTGAIHVSDMTQALPPMVMMVLLSMSTARITPRNGRSEKSWASGNRGFETFLRGIGPTQGGSDLPVFREPVFSAAT